ncbi:hypothetical protein IE53DRAFT_385101 [Violaceomyces palustris]|uniref:Uncharacterized protein n=1 Tax=Violaceomyces palustris TaxID=1673888 RepID=A0ACD0P366_9BASI|nr:hypothetical protein IE53DRAFT_385101 [Violaceomyces palustris]
MPPKRSTSGNALGLSGSKARSTLSNSFKKSASPSIVKPIKPTATKNLQHSSSGSSSKSEDASNERKHTREKILEAEGRPELDVGDPRLDALWGDTMMVMGMPSCKPIHSEGKDRIQHMLRVFDLDPTYGPCIGMTRLERWERAHELGENPPREIYEILTTKQGILDHEECVFKEHGL